MYSQLRSRSAYVKLGFFLGVIGLQNKKGKPYKKDSNMVAVQWNLIRIRQTSHLKTKIDSLFCRFS